MLTPPQVIAYLERLDLTLGEASADHEGLCRLQDAHLRRVPFENLSIHLGEPISLEPEALVHKLTQTPLGGFCYEMNGGFALLLEALGFDVDRLEGRVYDDGQPGIRFDHLCLAVHLDRPYLVDVGFGAANGLPLRLDTDEAQADPNGTFRIVPTPGEDGWWDLEREGTPLYRFSRQPHDLADFADGCRYHQSSPESHFTKNSLCTLPTADGGRVTIAGRLLVTRSGGQRTEREVTDDTELLALYRQHFGIVLDRVPPR